MGNSIYFLSFLLWLLGVSIRDLSQEKARKRDVDVDVRRMLKDKSRCEELEAAQQTHQAKCSATLAEVREHVVNLTEALASMDAM